MENTIFLQPMTRDMYHAFFREYENDPDLYLDPGQLVPYIYSEEKVDNYVQRQLNLQRLPFAIVLGQEIVGELKLYDIVPGQQATLGITMKNSRYKDRGFGTQAERLAIAYVFDTLDIPVLYADSVLTNTRSQHVLEKVGFRLLGEDSQKRYYQIIRPL